jgi:hyperosmotically inducible protein
MRITSLLLVVGLAVAGCDQTTDTTTDTTTPATGVPSTSTPGTTDTTTPPAPDNTAINERDAAGTTKTPLDQGETPEDRKITEDIRKKVTDDLSTINARNVKIVTAQGKVTLRGPVNSEAEKEAIEKIAHEVAGADNVTSEIDVLNR